MLTIYTPYHMLHIIPEGRGLYRIEDEGVGLIEEHITMERVDEVIGEITAFDSKLCMGEE